MGKRFPGRVKTVRLVEGYGFIAWEHGRDVFFHVTQVGILSMGVLRKDA